MGAPDANGDAIFNGAVDNATGTAGLLELARIWGQAPRPERSIVMISFTAEESGLLGSEFYAANPVYPLATTVAGFNMDAMNVYGRVANLGVIGYGQSELDERLTTAAERQGRHIEPDGNPAAGSYFRSDHFPLAKRGVPMAYAEGGGEFRDEPWRRAMRPGMNTAPNATTRLTTNGRRTGICAVRSRTWRWPGGSAVIWPNSRDWPGWKDGSEFGPARAASAAQRR